MVYQCRFCATFINSPSYLRQPIGIGNGSVIDRRQCLVAKKVVEGTDGCEKLILPAIIYCHKTSSRMYREACTRKYIAGKEEDCKRCSDGKELVALVRRVGATKRKEKIMREQNNGNYNRNIGQHRMQSI